MARQIVSSNWVVEQQSKLFRQKRAHEAGHAVIARVLGVPIGWTVLEPKKLSDMAPKHSGVLSYVQVRPPAGVLKRWSYYKGHRSRETAIHALLMVYMAGRIAEDLLMAYTDYKEAAFGSMGEGGDYGAERKLVAELKLNAEQADKLNKRLWRLTYEMVRRHETTIRRVALASHKYPWLTPQMVEDIIDGWGFSKLQEPKNFKKR